MDQYQRHFNRFEFKYVMPFDSAMDFVSQISDKMAADSYAGENGAYKINSLYYDSEKLDFFWEKIEGIKVRRKLRVRTYGTEKPTDAFIEIKQRIDKTVQKMRVKMNYEQALEILDKKDPGNIKDGILNQALYLVDHYVLKPQAVISYDRYPFTGIYDQGLRITVDTNLRCQGDRPQEINSREFSPYFFPPESSILEIKFNNSVPRWLTNHIGYFQCNLQRISKYCEGINKLGFNKS
jgi:SPX domain protein involved in polyphosphate accumulation